MVDIERVADSIRTKEVMYNSELSLNKDIFIARDIKNLVERKDFLLKTIEGQKELATKPKFVPPLIKGFQINEKWVPFPQNGRRLNPDQELIQQCEHELLIIEDLLIIDKLITEYSEVKGENAKKHYLLHAKEGQGNTLYWQPLYYSDHEFAQIIETIAALLEKPVDKSLDSVNQRLPWKGTMKDITELIKALSLTALTGTPETEIVQLFEAMFSDNKGNSLDIKKRYEVNKNELQDRKPRDMFTYKMNKAIDDFLKEKFQPNE